MRSLPCFCLIWHGLMPLPMRSNLPMFNRNVFPSAFFRIRQDDFSFGECFVTNPQILGYLLLVSLSIGKKLQAEATTGGWIKC